MLGKATIIASLLVTCATEAEREKKTLQRKIWLV